jgi:hypothetical protein
MLDWSRLAPSLSPIAQAGDPPAFGENGPPPITVPALTETRLELPYRLFISPDQAAAWRAASAPVTHSGRTELWHTRLIVPDGQSTGAAPQYVELDNANTAPIRAIWSADFSPTPSHAQDNDPFLSALTPVNRYEIVLRTSDFGVDGCGIPAQARRLMLSALGGFLDLRGSWPDQPQTIDLVEWHHLATLGRDHFVRVVKKGRLFPFGHRAAQVTITERQISSCSSGPLAGAPTAYLRQYNYIVVRDHELNYDATQFVHGGREMPFWPRVRINTTTTPKIDAPAFILDPSTMPATPTSSFWINVGGAPFPFSLTATDISGASSDITAGLIFVPTSDIPRALVAIRQAYVLGPRTCSVPNLRIAFAPALDGSDTTVLNTTALNFDAELDAGEAGFLPCLDSADVRLQAVEHLTGSIAPTTIGFYSNYLTGGFDPNAGVFAKILSSPVPAQFAAQQAGGIAQPNLSLTGLSRSGGPIAGDVAKAALDKLDPKDFFKDLSPTLFGVLPVMDLVDAAAGFASAAPKITTSLQPSAAAPQKSVTRLHWSISPQGCTELGVTFTPNLNGAAGALVIDVALEQPTPTPPSAPPPGTLTVDGLLTNFQLSIQDIISIGFKSFHFRSASGQKTAVDVSLADVDPIVLHGALEFIHKLVEAIPPGIFGQNGPNLDLEIDKVHVGFNIGLPPLAMGAFSLQNVTVLTGLDLPFISGAPTFSFAFSERHRPFLLTVTLVGGSGFFHIEVNSKKVVLVEASLEFGGAVSLDLGVASGSVQIMGGIYMSLSAGSADLSGIVDIGGEVSVLGLISISIEVNLSLSYDFDQKIARGQAVLTVGVSIAFFSTTVSLSVERSFSAGSDHISIRQMMTPADWQAYGEAFA